MELSISEASAATGVAVDTLRYWERAGLLVDVPRDTLGRRAYGEDDLRWVRFVRRMRSTGMPTEDVAAYARMVRLGESTVDGRRAILERHRVTVAAAAAELGVVLDLLDAKIADYEKAEAGPSDNGEDPPLTHVARLG